MKASISPYIFDENVSDKFIAHCAKLQNAYFWACVFVFGTNVNYHMIHLSPDNLIFIVDPVNNEDGCLTPEEFLLMLCGYEENGRYWGYSWTIKTMVHAWDNILDNYIQPRLCTNEVGIVIHPLSRTYEIENKKQLWHRIHT